MGNKRCKAKQIVNMGNVPNNDFQFKNEFNGEFLLELYENLPEIHETFTVIICQLKEELSLSDEKFKEKDKEGIRKIYHKIKPLWGYVGLNEMQEKTQQFETICTNQENFESILTDFTVIRKKSGDGLELLIAETDRLKLFI